MNFEKFLAKTKLERHQYQADGVEWCLQKEREGNRILGKYKIKADSCAMKWVWGKLSRCLLLLCVILRLKHLLSCHWRS